MRENKQTAKKEEEKKRQPPKARGVHGEEHRAGGVDPARGRDPGHRHGVDDHYPVLRGLTTSGTSPVDTAGQALHVGNIYPHLSRCASSIGVTYLEYVGITPDGVENQGSSRKMGLALRIIFSTNNHLCGPKQASVPEKKETCPLGVLCECHKPQTESKDLYGSSAKHKVSATIHSRYQLLHQ